MKVIGAGLNIESILVNAHKLAYGQQGFYFEEYAFYIFKTHFTFTSINKAEKNRANMLL